MTVLTLVAELKAADKKRKNADTVHEGQAEFLAVVQELLDATDAGLLTRPEFLQIINPYRHG